MGVHKQTNNIQNTLEELVPVMKGGKMFISSYSSSSQAARSTSQRQRRF